MEEILFQLNKAINEDKFIEFIKEFPIQHQLDENFHRLVEIIIKLHNEKKIDINVEFLKLKQLDDKKILFITFRLYEKVLPEINFEILSIINCINYLRKISDTVYLDYIDSVIRFCEKRLDQIQKFIELILESTEERSHFLFPCLIAGSRHMIEKFHPQIIQFTKHEHIDIRRQAISCLGDINFSNNKSMLNQTIEVLKELAEIETDDLLLNFLINVLTKIFVANSSINIEDILSSMKIILSKGNKLTFNAVSEIVKFYSISVPDEFLDILFEFLKNPNYLNEGIIENIDYGIVKLLTHGNFETSIKHIESFLLLKLSIKIFKKFIYYLSVNQIIIKQLTTQWFLKGEFYLCNAILDILESISQNIYLEVDKAQVDCSNHNYLFFLARKTAGFLFYKPISAVSMIISLMDYSENEQLIKGLVSLIYDPLLINYPSLIKNYLISVPDFKSDTVKKFIQDTLDKLETYRNAILSVGEIPELLPTQRQREAYNRHYFQQVNEAYEKAQNHSYYATLAHKSIILYGRKSVNYIQSLNGELQRHEIIFKKIGTEIEIPRIATIDIVGFEYELFQFKFERLKNETSY